MTIDTLRQIAENLYLSLECVDCLQGKGLRSVFFAIFGNVCDVFPECVDLGAETLTG